MKCIQTLRSHLFWKCCPTYYKAENEKSQQLNYFSDEETETLVKSQRSTISASMLKAPHREGMFTLDTKACDKRRVCVFRKDDSEKDEKLLRIGSNA